MQVKCLILFVVQVLDVVDVYKAIQRRAYYIVQVRVVLYLGDPALMDLLHSYNHAVNMIVKHDIWSFNQGTLFIFLFIFFADVSTFFQSSLTRLCDSGLFHLLLQCKLCTKFFVKFGCQFILMALHYFCFKMCIVGAEVPVKFCKLNQLTDAQIIANKQNLQSFFLHVPGALLLGVFH